MTFGDPLENSSVALPREEGTTSMIFKTFAWKMALKSFTYKKARTWLRLTDLYRVHSTALPDLACGHEEGYLFLADENYCTDVDHYCCQYEEMVWQFSSHKLLLLLVSAVQTPTPYTMSLKTLQPSILHPQPSTPKPTHPNPRSQALNPKPYTLRLKPGALPQPSTLNTQLRLLKTQHPTLNTQHLTLNT